MFNPKWIFFDLGWTLVDESRAHLARLKETRKLLAKLGMDQSLDDLLRGCEQAAIEFAPSAFWGMLERLGLTEEQQRSVVMSVGFGGPNEYGKEKEALYPRVPEVLNSLSSRYRLGVIANQSEGTERRLEQWGVRDCFSLILASAELGLSKPDPRIFERALRETNCLASEALMVGDRIDNDIGPARAGGWKAARVLQGFFRFQKPRNQHEQPDFTIPEIQDLPREMGVG